MTYLVFDADRVIQSFQSDSDDADAIVNENPGWMKSSDLPIATVQFAQPGDRYLPDGTITASDLSVPNLEFRSGLRDAFEQLIAWNRAGYAEGYLHPHSEVVKMHTFIYWAHVGLYMVAHDPLYTPAQKTAFATGLAMGALDVTNVSEFYSVSQTLTAPTFPNVWCNPATGARVDLAQSLVLSGPTQGNLNLEPKTRPTAAQLGAAIWIDLISGN